MFTHLFGHEQKLSYKLQMRPCYYISVHSYSQTMKIECFRNVIERGETKVYQVVALKIFQQNLSVGVMNSTCMTPRIIKFNGTF